MSLKNRQQLKTRSKTLLSTRNLMAGAAGLIAVLSILFITNMPESGEREVISIVGKDGARTVTSSNQILNQYAVLSADASAGAISLTVGNIADLSNGTALAAEDLVMIIQMQGATISSTDNATFGTVTNYNNAGNYEFAYVSGISGNEILLSCGLIHDYTASGHAQVVRVPQYTNLTINPGASVTASAWNGSKGGVIAIVAEEVISVNGTLSTAGKGFRGGQRDNTTAYNQRGYKYSSASSGGEKGEGIAGYQTEYTALGARYGRGAAANGGGGGNAHNAGGGGGANGNNGSAWNGQGVMCQTCTGSGAWQLDDAYISNGNAYTTSSGGGRGGYSYGSSNQNALTLAPESSGWGGDRRRQLGGLGGQPLTNDPAHKIFGGGGGGAGDGNNNASQDGADGGGLIFLIADEVSGAGTVSADGANAEPTKSGHNDGPGGGGGGGSILIHAHAVTGLTLSAKGGKGGDQLITNNESEGPGGGGSGGYIAIPGHATVTTSVAGGTSGTTKSASVTEFTVNGATDGAPGMIYASLSYIPFCSSYDHDGDGISDEIDLDDDNDGVPDWIELGCNAADLGTGACPDPVDKTANGLPRYLDASACSGGSLVNGVCPEYDTDGDGIPDFLDKDSDNDGIPDLIEAGGVDTDGDGLVDTANPDGTLSIDSDNDGWSDTYDDYDNGGSGFGSGTPLPYLDSDKDGIMDQRDLDSDNDGMTDLFESGGASGDTDGDGMLGAYGSPPADNDSDGLADVVDPVDGSGGGITGTPLILTGSVGTGVRPASFVKGDNDGDVVPDYRDIDSDADGIADWTEAQASGASSPTDGLMALLGTDVDGDGLDDAFDVKRRDNGDALGGTPIVPLNTDNDGEYDYLDVDTDEDGFLDLVEGHDADQNGVADISPTGVDADGDGLDDAFDLMTDRNDADFSRQNAAATSAPVQNSDGANDRDWREVNGAPSTMPVEWMYFSGEMVAGNGKLTWGTAREINSLYFEIERSVDGQVFESLDQVQAAGYAESVSEYTYTDVSLSSLAVPAVLYRLRQVDLDGQFEYSNLVELKLGESAQEMSLTLYPNPASEHTTVQLTTVAAGEWDLRVLSMSGQVIHSQQVATMGGRQETELNCGNWTAGYYIVQMSNGVQRLSKKLQVR